MNLYDEFEQLIQRFNEAGVEYAVVGAMALAVHGAPRATTDIDFLVRPEDLQRITTLVADLGFTLPAEPMTFSNSGLSIQRITKISEGETLTLDLLLLGEALGDVWVSRVCLKMGDQALWVVSREGLLQMKALAGRLQDLADIKRLETPEDEVDDG
jgi:hypothetical protein